MVPSRIIYTFLHFRLSSTRVRFTRVELWPLSILRDVQMASRKAIPHMDHPIPIILSGAIPIDGEERSLHLQDYTMQEMLDDLKVDHPTKELHQALHLSGESLSYTIH